MPTSGKNPKTRSPCRAAASTLEIQAVDTMRCIHQTLLAAPYRVRPISTLCSKVPSVVLHSLAIMIFGFGGRYLRICRNYLGSQSLKRLVKASPESPKQGLGTYTGLDSEVRYRLHCLCVLSQYDAGKRSTR